MWIKICGIRNMETAVALAEMGVDAIGLNFYTPSCRYVSPEMATEIVASLPKTTLPVGLFVNHTPTEIHNICQQTGIRTVQLHGDETHEDYQRLSELGDYQIISVFRSPQEGAPARKLYEADQREIQKHNLNLFATLVDAYVENEFGGTGKIAAWNDWKPEHRKPEWPNLILAGGLTPNNIAKAIEAVHPWGVDVAGGVESERGIKDLKLCREFIHAAQS